MNEELPDTIQSLTFKYPIWSLLYSEVNKSLIVDTRNEAQKSVMLFELMIDAWNYKKIDIKLSWFEKLVGVHEGRLFAIEYTNENDPSSHNLKEIKLSDFATRQIEEFPVINNNVQEPSFFELGSSNHQLVVDFLAIELPLSCEYLEFEDYIIISYYLRSEDGFDRFILLLNDGKKVWKTRQDHKTRGFAAGSFFVVESQLVFVKDRNEVCIFSL